MCGQNMNEAGNARYCGGVAKLRHAYDPKQYKVSSIMRGKTHTHCH